MTRVWGSLFVVLLALGMGWTQQDTSAENAPADKEDIEKLFVTLHLREMIQNVTTASMQQTKQMSHDVLKKKLPGISDEELKRMDAFLDDLIKQIDISGMIDDMIPVYRRHLTKGDVRAMLAFYDSPTGQKILREQPAMTAEGMQAMQPRMQKMMADVTDKAQKMAREMAEKENSSQSKR